MGRNLFLRFLGATIVTRPGTDPNTEVFAHRGQAKRELRNYFFGLFSCLVLTAIAFWTVTSEIAVHSKLLIIFICAIVQIFLQLRLFLHISFVGRQSIEDLLLILFTTLLLTILIAGTIWILGDLSGRMHDPAAPPSKHAVIEPNNGTSAPPDKDGDAEQ